MTISVDGEVLQANVRAFERACKRYQTEVGRGHLGAVRSGLIDLVKSLRAKDGGTREAKKRVPASDIVKVGYSKYKTYTNNKGKKKRMPLWMVKRRRGSNTTVLFRPARKKSEVTKTLGKIANAGLARKSWGWFMRSLFNRAEGVSAKPRAQIDGSMVSIETPLHERVVSGVKIIEVSFTNKLDYIRSALYPGSLNRAFQKATNSINKKINDKLVKEAKRFK